MALPTEVADRSKHVGVASWWPLRFKTWKTWEPDPCPNVESLLWKDAPWLKPIDDTALVDETATRAWHTGWDSPVRTEVGEVSYMNVHGGTPWQDITNGRPGVINEVGPNLPPWMWEKFSVKMPKVIRRYDDPTGSQDTQWIGFDFDKKEMWEVGAMRPTFFGEWVWAAYSVSVWDLTKPWTETKNGVTATNLPMVPMIPRYEEFLAGEIKHALQFSADKYNRKVVWPARGADGDHPDSPLCPGHRLALRQDWKPSRTLTQQEQILVTALKKYGAFVSDKTNPDHGSTIRKPMDPRISFGDLGLRHKDFLILEPQS